MSGGTPTVSLVVTGAQGGAELLDRSVASVRQQSLRSVELLTADAADGLARATGEFIGFLPSGNTLDRHACRTAVGAARQSACDVVSARWEATHGSPVGSVPALFRRTAHYPSLAANPELVYDTCIGNKLFRTDFLRRVGLQFSRAAGYAEADFVTRAYALASGVTLLPHLLYLEHLPRPAPSADELLRASRELDLFLAERSSDEVVTTRQLQFLEQELPGCLASLPGDDDEPALALVRSVRDYLASVSADALTRAGKLAQIAEYLARQDDVDGLRAIGEAQLRPETADAHLVRRDGRVYWTDRHLGTPEGRTVLDVTRLGWPTATAEPPVPPRQETAVRPGPARRLVAAVAARAPVFVRILGSGETKSSFYRHVFVRLPLKPRSVVFESHMGMAYSDNPRYICEELLRRAPEWDVVWSFADAPPPVPAGVRTVRRSSWGHYWALARAKVWVDNQGLPATIVKPARTTYVQTWHGSALKRMGEDTPAFRSLPEERRERHRAAVARWDYFVVRSEHDVRTLVPALRVRGEILRYGYPRNDPLVTVHSDEERNRIRRDLGLPVDAVLVLYAPTFRESYAEGRREFALPIDLDELSEVLPNHLLLVRTHYLQRLRLPAATHPAVRDVSHVPDITPLLTVADVLVTDYSSVMFDFANTRRPIIFYVYDYDEYANDARGVYWDLASLGPGPMVRTSEELIARLASVDEWRQDYADRYRSFVDNFGEYDTGEAARQVVDHVFLGGVDDH